MKIAVAASGGSLSAQVAQNFGRCPYFLIVDSETMKFEAVQNSAASYTGGAGPAAAKLIENKNAKILLTGGTPGGNAEKALLEYGIKIVSGTSGMVKDAVSAYLSGTK